MRQPRHIPKAIRHGPQLRLLGAILGLLFAVGCDNPKPHNAKPGNIYVVDPSHLAPGSAETPVAHFPVTVLRDNPQWGAPSRFQSRVCQARHTPTTPPTENGTVSTVFVHIWEWSDSGGDGYVMATPYILLSVI